MKKETAKSWCLEATKLIKFPPDREAVQEELEQHLIDKQEDLRQQGIPEEEIEALAIAAMGSAEEIAPQLAAIHRPFWGYAYRVIRIILAIGLSFLLLHAVINAEYLVDRKREPVFTDYVAGTTLRWQTYPNTKTKMDNCRITIEQVRFSKNPEPAYANIPRLSNCLSADIRVTDPRGIIHYDIMEYVWAEDSLGNVYTSPNATSHLPPYPNDHYIRVSSSHRIFSSYYRITFMGYEDNGAQWIDLHYDRDGRSFTIRIDLEGGAAA